jgi:hypothetical protein
MYPHPHPQGQTVTTHAHEDQGSTSVVITNFTMNRFPKDDNFCLLPSDQLEFNA